MSLASPESTARGTRYARRAAAPGAWLRLGDILLESGAVTEAQLTAALQAKRASGRRVGEELVAAGHLRSERLASALKLQRRLAVLAFAAALVPISRDAHGGEARARMTVSATVVDTVSVRSIHQAQQLVIAAEDVRRGYVDVPAASRFDIRCASACLFEFRPTHDLVRAVRVTGLDTAAEFGSAGASVLHKTTAAAPHVAINYRFTLGPNVQPGAYGWPVALSIVPM